MFVQYFDWDSIEPIQFMCVCVYMCLRNFETFIKAKFRIFFSIEFFSQFYRTPKISESRNTRRWIWIWNEWNLPKCVLSIHNSGFYVYTVNTIDNIQLLSGGSGA